MEVIKTGKALGAEIIGIDLSLNVSKADQTFIFDAYTDNLVLLFKGQSLSCDDLLRLREVFGTAGLTANQLLGLGRKKYYPDEVPDDITIISNIIEEGGRPRGSLGDGEAFWHTDSSFTEVPISASLLHAIEVSDEGGETSFLNMYQAYDDLPERLRIKVDGQFANHSKAHSSDGSLRPEYEEPTNPATCPGIKHPMVRVHPATNRKCLDLAGRINSYIFGLILDESEELLDELWAHSCQDKYVWEHKWEVGDILVWDNRCTMHHRNAFPSEARRLMHKSITAGEAVIAG